MYVNKTVKTKIKTNLIRWNFDTLMKNLCNFTRNCEEKPLIFFFILVILKIFI